MTDTDNSRSLLSRLAGRATALRLSRFRLVVGITSILLVGTVAGATYAAISPAVSSSTSDVMLQRNSSVTLSYQGGKSHRVTVLSVSLPEGSWVLSADATAVDFYEQDTGRCGLFNGATELNEHSNLINTIGAVSVATAVTTSGIFTASLQCWHDSSVPAGHVYVDHGASLWAHKASSLAKTIVP